MNRKQLSLLLLLSLNLSAMGQGRISFAYDEAGNRVKRELFVRRSKVNASKDLMRDESFYDSVGELAVRITRHSSGVIDVRFLNLKPTDKGFIEVCSVSGAIVFRQEISSGMSVVDFSSQPQGVYVLRVVINEKPTTWKITKA